LPLRHLQRSSPGPALGSLPSVALSSGQATYIILERSGGPRVFEVRDRHGGRIDPYLLRQLPRARSAATKTLRVLRERRVQGRLPPLQDFFRLPVVHLRRGQQRDARMVMLGVIPVEVALAERLGLRKV